VIRLGLRLAFSGEREAAARLVLLTVAVGLGVGLLLTALSGINAVNSQNARYAWLDTTAAHQKPNGKDPLWGMVTADGFDGQAITRVDVAATGPTSPVPPGIPKLPGPGQYYASPALASLLASTPADELAARYPVHQAGLIGDAALPSPDSLIIVIGHASAQLSQVKDADEVWGINTTPAQQLQRNQLPGHRGDPVPGDRPHLVRGDRHSRHHGAFRPHRQASQRPSAPAGHGGPGVVRPARPRAGARTLPGRSPGRGAAGPQQPHRLRRGAAHHLTCGTSLGSAAGQPSGRCDRGRHQRFRPGGRANQDRP
jgi:hypothetical protein